LARTEHDVESLLLGARRRKRFRWLHEDHEFAAHLELGLDLTTTAVLVDFDDF
jgi:hypothetical protein